MRERLYERIRKQLEDMRDAGTYKDYRYLGSPMSARSLIERSGEVLVYAPTTIWAG